MSGHGHVKPNPDGSKAKCGGPGICAVCARELAAVQFVAPSREVSAERQRLDAEWNAAIEEAALNCESMTAAWSDDACRAFAQLVRNLKREVKP